MKIELEMINNLNARINILRKDYLELAKRIDNLTKMQNNGGESKQ